MKLPRGIGTSGRSIALHKLQLEGRVVLQALLYFWICSFSFSYMPQPSTWGRHSPDGKYMLVVLSPLSLSEELNDPHVSDIRKSEIEKLRSSYKSSGIYRTTEEAELIWKLNIYLDPTYRENTFIIRNGSMVVVTRNSWESTYNGDALKPDEAVMVIEKGGLVRYHLLKDLFLSCTVDRFLNRHLIKQRHVPTVLTYDEASHCLFIGTSWGEMVRVNVITGMVSRIRWPVWARTTVAIIVIAILSICFAHCLRAARKGSKRLVRTEGNGLIRNPNDP